MRLYLRADLLKRLNTMANTEQIETVKKLLSTDLRRKCYLAWRGPEVGDPLLIMRADCASKRINLQGSVSKSLPQPILAFGDFPRSFPDLDDLAKHLNTLSLDELQTFFFSEKSRSGERIELPFVKLPGEGITFWGTAIILAITAYLSAVFRDFSSRAGPNDKAWNVPWIGTSTESMSRMTFAVTMLLPSVTVGYVTFRGSNQINSTWVGLGCAIAVFLLLTFLSGDIVYSWVKSLRLRTK